MLHFEQTIDCPAQCFAAFGVPPEQVLYFDIETTGFSPDSSYVYLIGCAFLHNGTPTLRQWFLDDLSEEKKLLREFDAFAANFSMLAHYNGTTFDIPYLQKKARRHRLPGTYFYPAQDGVQAGSPSSASGGGERASGSSGPKDGAQAGSPSSGQGGGERAGSLPQKGAVWHSFDIYKKLLPYKKQFGLKDLKQKTVEQFLKIKRDDIFNGGGLIPVYTEFVGRYRYECLTCGNPFQKENPVPPDMDTKMRTASHKEPVGSPDGFPNFEDTGLTRMPESPAKALLYVLLLHNREDITGLLAITDLLAVTGLFAGEFRITELTGAADIMPFWGGTGKAPMTYPSSCRLFRLNTKIPARLLSCCFPGEIARELPLCAVGRPAVKCESNTADKSGMSQNERIPVQTGAAGMAETTNAADADAPPMPHRVTLSVLPDSFGTTESSGMSAASGSLLLSVPVFSGTLKHFFSDYREYYYLPFEDCAIHKSVAQFVDREYRKKATKDTCYQKKSGSFLPQPAELIAPAFRLHAKDTFAYFENTDAALSDADTLKKWACSLLEWLLGRTH